VGVALRVLPLGGCGEVGLNATLLVDEATKDAVLVDCGVMFADGVPGVDRFVPDFGPLHVDGRRLRAVVLTHGHEDHIGALGDLFLEADVPIYGLPLTVALARARLEARGMPSDRLQTVALGRPLVVGAFQFEWIHVTHSIPDAAALLVTTAAGRVLHTGDFKLDRDPIDGRQTDLERLRGLEVDLMLSDSTNAERAGATVPERRVATELEALAEEIPGRMVVACFASHFHRLEGLARAASRANRQLVLVGHALHRNYMIGRATGHIRFDATLARGLGKLASIPPRELMLVVTGSQGEPRAALSKLARGDQLDVDGTFALGPDDRVVLSSTKIPGNERAIRAVVNHFARQGVPLVDDRARCVHCSGHAHADEQGALLDLVRPKSFVPIHGDRAMLEAHARLARARGVPEVEVLEDGQAVLLTPGGALTRVPGEPVQRQAVDLLTDRRLGPDTVELRGQLARAGLVRATLVVDGARVVGAEVEALAVADAPRVEQRLREAVEAELARDPAQVPIPVVERVRDALRRASKGDRGAGAHVTVSTIKLGGPSAKVS
jgi:ribonuclease J